MKKKKVIAVRPPKKKVSYKKHIPLKLTPERLPLTISGNKNDLLKAFTYYQNKPGSLYADMAIVVFNELAPLKEDRRNAGKFTQDNLKIEMFILNSFVKYWIESPDDHIPKILRKAFNADHDSLLTFCTRRPKADAYTVLLLIKGLSYFVDHIKPVREYLERRKKWWDWDQKGPEPKIPTVIKKYISEGKQLFFKKTYPNKTAAQSATMSYCWSSQLILNMIDNKETTINRELALLFYRINASVLWYVSGITESMRHSGAAARLFTLPSPTKNGDIDDPIIWEYYHIAQAVLPFKK